MTVIEHALPPDGALSGRTDHPVICIPWTDEPEAASRTLAGIVAHTAPQAPIVLAGWAKRDLEQAEISAPGSGEHQRSITTLEVGSQWGFAAAVNAAIAATSGDLVVVAPGVLVGPQWLERLRAAAHCDSTVASATPLGDHAGMLSVGDHGDALSQPEAALALIAGSCRSYPRITSAGAHCVYLRRALLERVGVIDTAIETPADAMADFSLGALALGMTHVAADDVFVLCPPGGGQAQSALLASDLEEERTALHRSLACARVAMRGMSVTIDARALGPGVGGTQDYTVKLVLALAASGAIRLRVVVAPDLPVAIARLFEREPALEVISYEEAVEGVAPTDIVHRPQQVFSADDLTLLHLLGERIVIGQQDLIAYRNPAYHATVERWQRYRRVTRLALTVADRVVFFSEHAKRDVLAEDLISEERGDVVGIGADVPGSGGSISGEPVAGVPLDRDLLVCIGADYQHKNRPFAIELLGALRQWHSWEGCLVLAGSHVPNGSSREEEQRLLAESPDLAGAVIDVGVVGEAQKAWLYERARAVVYPTTYEGFGLVPFEAAGAGTPCLFAPQASLVELAGAQAATLIPWDPRLTPMR